MELTFGKYQSLPEKYTPGKVYFIESEGAIYLAISETEVKKYSGYKELENKQDYIEDLDTIRTGATIAKSISVVETSDIDRLFE